MKSSGAGTSRATFFIVFHGRGGILNDPFEIPAERLPAGFAQSIEMPPDSPAEPKPAATAVLLRDGEDGPEVLLLQRSRNAGFVPGAYVFPGGRVDPGDEAFASILPATNSGPPAAYLIAAVREIFEETGVLLARFVDGSWAPDASSDPMLEAWREKLMTNGATIGDLLYEEGLSIALDQLAYYAHWITPIAEPRRYDTRFFVAALPPGRTARPDPREMTDAIWVTPAAALAQFDAGALPMVFPTVKTLQHLNRYTTVAEILAETRTVSVEPVLPRLVRTARGVGIVIDQENA